MTTAREHHAGLGKLRQTYERTLNSWLRPAGSGWRFTDTQGRVYPLSSEDGEELHRIAHEQLDDMFSSLEGQVWYMLIPAMLVGMLAVRMTDEFVLYGAMPTAVYFVPCLMFLFKDVITEIRFIWAMTKWRDELARQLRQAMGREHEAADYSLFKDERLLVWIGWCLFGPGLVGFMLFYDNFEAFFLCLGMTGAGAFTLKAAYGVA